jgi:hypothetical protein
VQARHLLVDDAHAAAVPVHLQRIIAARHRRRTQRSGGNTSAAGAVETFQRLRTDQLITADPVLRHVDWVHRVFRSHEAGEPLRRVFLVHCLAGWDKVSRLIIPYALPSCCCWSRALTPRRRTGVAAAVLHETARRMDHQPRRGSAVGALLDARGRGIAAAGAADAGRGEQHSRRMVRCAAFATRVASQLSPRLRPPDVCVACVRIKRAAATELLVATAAAVGRTAVLPMDVQCEQWGIHPISLEPLTAAAQEAKGMLLPMAGWPGRCIVNQYKTKAYLGSRCGVCPTSSFAFTTVQLQPAWFTEQYPHARWVPVQGSAALLTELRERSDLAVVVRREDLVAHISMADVEESRRGLNTCTRFGQWL